MNSEKKSAPRSTAAASLSGAMCESASLPSARRSIWMLSLFRFLPVPTIIDLKTSELRATDLA